MGHLHTVPLHSIGHTMYALIHHTVHSPSVTVTLSHSGRQIISSSTLAEVVRVLRLSHVPVRLSRETVQYLIEQGTITDSLT